MDHFNEAVLLPFFGYYDGILWAVPILFLEVCPWIFVGSVSADQNEPWVDELGYPMVFLCC